MSFWNKALDVAKNAGTAIVSEIESSANESREIKQKYEIMNDDELIKILSSDGFLGRTKKEKGVAFSLLKSRGYSADQLKSKM